MGHGMRIKGFSEKVSASGFEKCLECKIWNRDRNFYFQTFTT